MVHTLRGVTLAPQSDGAVHVQKVTTVTVELMQIRADLRCVSAATVPFTKCINRLIMPAPNFKSDNSDGHYNVIRQTDHLIFLD